MKKTITLFVFMLTAIGNSQTTADFESFSLTADSFYYDAGGMDWQTTNASFQYDWNTSFGGFWSGGFAYTNKKDTSNGGYQNPYNCAAYTGYNSSNYYVAAQPNGIIRVKAPSTGVVGFYATNSTYAYKSMKHGDSFAKKFGGTSGNDPDWFKLLVKGYSGGVLKSDSIEFYLADFRSSNNSFDYILKTWQWVDCTALGSVDSVTFYLSSSDAGSFGMNTPAFFCLDNFTTGQGVGINEINTLKGITLFPNPGAGIFNIRSESFGLSEVSIYNSVGSLLKNESVEFSSGSNTHQINIEELNEGLYFVEIKNESKKQIIKFIKN